jgi:hypothetical protein
MKEQSKLNVYVAFFTTSEQAAQVSDEAQKLGLTKARFIRNAIEYSLRHGFKGLRT